MALSIRLRAFERAFNQLFSMVSNHFHFFLAFQFSMRERKKRANKQEHTLSISWIFAICILDEFSAWAALHENGVFYPRIILYYKHFYNPCKWLFYWWCGEMKNYQTLLLRKTERETSESISNLLLWLNVIEIRLIDWIAFHFSCFRFPVFLFFERQRQIAVWVIAKPFKCIFSSSMSYCYLQQIPPQPIGMPWQ